MEERVNDPNERDYPQDRGRFRDPADTAGRPISPSERRPDVEEASIEGEQIVEIREERLVPHREMRQVGEVEIRKEIEEVPGRLEVEALREEVEVEHVPVGQVVSERVEPWEENGALVVPVYEEQLVVVKRLVLREQLRIRRVGITERQLFEDTLRRERAVIDDPTSSGLVHDRYSTERTEEEKARQAKEDDSGEGGFLENLGRKILS